MHIIGDEFSYENSLFTIDATGKVMSLFFPVRVYDYN
jgi:hypothetical protein